MYHVMELERFAVHDGPGIRTTVFLKGCALHCPWCANPESQSHNIQLLYDAKKCVGCGACAAVCAHGAIVQREGECPPPKAAEQTCAAQTFHTLQSALPLQTETQRFATLSPLAQAPVLHRTACVACGACVRTCAQKALTLCGTQMTAQEIVAVCLRDQDYYKESGGGVTLSGGEPLLAGAALLPLLCLLKENGVHVAVETCGHVPFAALAILLPYLDLFLFDIKHANADKLKDFTGADAALIARNLATAVASGKRVVARVPVIPRFNHTPEEMEAIFTLCAANGVQEANLLAYHTLGKGKYAQLGIVYQMDAPMLQKAELAPYVPLAAQHGITATLGG